MKAKEELKTIKEEAETLNEKLKELSEDELKEIYGGIKVLDSALQKCLDQEAYIG